MSPVFTLLWNTIVKEYRSRVLIIVTFTTIVSLAITNQILGFLSEEALSNLATFEMGNMAVRVFFWILEFWMTFVAIFLSVDCIRSDIKDQVIPQILSLPISRWQYLGMRLLGMWLLIVIFNSLVVVAAVSSFSLTLGQGVGGIEVLYSLGFSAAKLLGIVILGALVGIFTGPLLGFFLFSIFYVFIYSSNSLATMIQISESTDTHGGFKILAQILHQVFPRMGTMGGLSGNILFEPLAYELMPVFAHYSITCVLWFLIFGFIFRNKHI